VYIGFQQTNFGWTNIVKNKLNQLMAIGNHDFCPWANRYLYWLKQPIGWFVVATAAAAMMAVCLEPRIWVVVVSLVAVMAMGVVWPWIAMRGASAEITFDCRRCRAGDSVQVRLAIHNRWPWSLWGLSVENGFFLETAEGESRPVAALARVPGWSRSEFVFEYQPEARGVYPVSAPELATAFPFGLWRAAKKVALRSELLVWPRTTPLTSIPSLGGDVADVVGMLFDRPGQEGDMIGVRPFRDGDRLRSIHWAQTARREGLIVTERQAAAQRLVVVAVDVAAFVDGWSDRNVQPTVVAEKSLGRIVQTTRELETAIEVAASIAQEFHVHHAQVRFVIGDVDLLLSLGGQGLHRLLDELARYQVEPSSLRSPNGFGREALAVVVTSNGRQAMWQSSVARQGLLRLVLIESSSPSNQQLGNAFQDSHTNSPRNVWITLNREADSSLQLRHQWKGVCHDSNPVA